MPSGATTLSRPPGSSQSQPRRKFRLDIQGLRAFAVIVVILDHMFAWPTGGFVGVDIFFVISGFLITGHLMREWEQTGHISFLKFYKGRIKRILPAATLVLAVTVGASFLLLNKSRAMSVLWDGVWASLFAGNWRFAAAGTDYFQADGPVSPLQHFWSLAVEEQFYFVWPWIMLLALVMVGRANAAKMRSRVVAGLLLGALSAASFAWAMVETTGSPTMAYFSTFSRAWELGLGALLAIVAPLMLKMNDRIRPVLAWAGIAGMVTSVFVINSSMAFPAPTALLPVLSTVLVIAAGTGGEQKFLTPLTNPVSAYIGNISYSLYLWHFPVIILVGPLLLWDGVIAYLVQLGIIAFVSVAAYHMWEDAIRKGPWLEGRQAWKKYKLPKWYGTAALGALAIVTVAAVGSTFLPQSPPATPPASAVEKTGQTSGAGKENAKKEEEFTPEVKKLQDGIEAALVSTQWPKLKPVMDDSIGSAQAPAEYSRCGKVLEPIDPSECVFGSPNAKHAAFIVGDSIAMTYAAPLVKALGKDWKITLRAAYGCSFSPSATTNPNSEIVEACPDFNKETVALINSQKPDTVFVSHTYDQRVIKETNKSLSPDQWGSFLGEQLSKLPSNSQKIFLSPVPMDKSIAECYGPRSSPAGCVSDVTSGWKGMLRGETSLANNIGGAMIDTRPLFCSSAGCPAFASGIPMKSDRTHMTVEYANSISPGLAELLSENL